MLTAKTTTHFEQVPLDFVKKITQREIDLKKTGDRAPKEGIKQSAHESIDNSQR